MHDSKLGKCHLPCCVVQVYGDRYLLCCCKGVLTTGYVKRQLTVVSGDVSISVDNWQTAAKTSLQDVANDSARVEVCNCSLSEPTVEHVDLTEDPNNCSRALLTAMYLQPSCPSSLCYLKLELEVCRPNKQAINLEWPNDKIHAPRKGLCSVDRILAQHVVFCSKEGGWGILPNSLRRCSCSCHIMHNMI